MANGMKNEEEKEAKHVINALDSVDFLFSKFGPWLKGNGFKAYDVGKFLTFKGRYGYVQLEFVVLRRKSMVVRCAYVPYSDTSKAYGLVAEGISSSGKSLSDTDMKLLKKLRYDQVESTVVNVIAEDTGLEVGQDMSLKGELELDEIDIQGIILRLEDEFNITIPDEDVERFGTVSDIIWFIRRTKGML